MAFSAVLRPDTLTAEAGANAPLTVEVSNKGTQLERVEIEIEGLDPDWTAVPVPVLEIAPGESQSAKVFLKPPRTSESLAGNYPFVLTVRSLETGEKRPLQGVLNLNPYHYVTAEISPKKGFYTATSRQNTFSIALVNLGNSEHTLQLTASDPENSCAYEYGEEQVKLGPGQQREVEVTAVPKKRPFLSGSRLIGFNVTARSIHVPSVAANVQAQLEQRPFLTPGTLAALLVLAFLVAAAIFAMPKAPTIEIYATPRQAVQGQEITLTWKARNASAVQIRVREGSDETILVEGPEIEGTRTYTAKSVGLATFVATPLRDGDAGRADRADVMVSELVAAPEPRIVTFAPNTKTVKLGEPFVLTYRFENVEIATISPLGTTLDLKINQIEIKPERTGTIEYAVAAQNKDGKIARRSFTVNVVDISDAAILSFDANPTSVAPEGGQVNLSWQVSNAARVEIQVGGPENKQVVDATGNTVIAISQSTKVTLIATDARGRSATKSIQIARREPAEPVAKEPFPETVPPLEKAPPSGTPPPN